MTTWTSLVALSVVGATVALAGCDKGGGGASPGTASSAKSASSAKPSGADLVKGAEEYAKAICACKDLECTSAPQSKWLQGPSKDSVDMPVEQLAKVDAAEGRARDCLAALGPK
jgi:hypothetical protein